MLSALSITLCERGIDVVEAGSPRQQTAKCFDVGTATQIAAPHGHDKTTTVTAALGTGA